jgi:penicillin amidase
MRKLKWIIGLAAVLVASIALGVYAYLRSTVPEYEGELIVDRLGGPVEIIRDRFGMPHIFAGSDEDACFALGYCCAQDRLFQMDMVRRSVRGQLSEVLGDRTINVDRLFRTITAGRPVDSMLVALPPEMVATMEAYAAGVNYYLATHEEHLPFEFALLGYQPAPWTAADELTASYYLAWALNFSFGNELLRSAVAAKVGSELTGGIFIDYPRDGPRIMPDSQAAFERLRLLETIRRAQALTGVPFGGASNSWVVSGEKSATGKPILANDMHLGLTIPSIWYEAHLCTPKMNVSGVVLPGVPLIVAGANEHVAWGFTNLMADDADYYMERTNPKDSSQYQYMDGWEEMIVRYDTIIVRGEGPVPITFRMTRHGVIIDDVVEAGIPPERPIAMRWTMTDFDRGPEALYRVNRAATIDEIEEALAFHKCPGQNWVYADDQGNIGYWAAAAIPIRNGFDGAEPVPGWDGRHEWAGYVPTEQLPHMRNPAQGWIATANNKPVGDDYPYVISHYYAPPDRFARIARLLEEKDKLSVDDCKRIQGDEYESMAERWVPQIIAAMRSLPLTAVRQEALEQLAAWDFVATADAAGAAVFHVVLQQVMENTFRERLGDTLYQEWLSNVFTVNMAIDQLVQEGRSTWFDNPRTEQVETLDSVLSKSFIQAVDYLTEVLGSNVRKWQWGRLHELTFTHPVGSHIPILRAFMNVGPFAMGGGSMTVNAGLYRLTAPYAMLAGSSQRHIFDLADMKKSLRIIPGGISGNFMSPHYDDQIDLWRQMEYRPFQLERSDLERDATTLMIMRPPTAVPDSASS